MAVHDCGLPIAIENVHNLVRQHGEAQLEHQQYLQNQVALQNAQLQVLQAQQQEFINGRIPPAAPPPVEMARPAIAAAECDGQDLVTFHHHIRPRHQERHRPHNRGWWVDDGDSSDDDADDYYYSSDSEYCAMRRLRPRHRHRHRHRSAVILNNTAPELLGRQTVVPQPQQPRSYGYRRLHVQGGRERGRRRNSCCAGQTPPQRCGRSPRRCILARCCRWLFGDPVVRCRCGQCCTGEPSLRSNSPMRHREEEYWGPGTHVGRKNCLFAFASGYDVDRAVLFGLLTPRLPRTGHMVRRVVVALADGATHRGRGTIASGELAVAHRTPMGSARVA